MFFQFFQQNLKKRPFFQFSQFFQREWQPCIDCLYCHPSSEISITDFTNSHFEPFLHKLGQENKHCKAKTDLCCITILNSLFNHLMTPYILQPSRLQSKTLIELIEFKSHSSNLLFEITDHLIQFLIIENLFKRNSSEN